MRTSNGLPLLLLDLPFEADDRPYAAVTQTLGPAAGDPGGCRQHVGYHPSLSAHGWIESDLACHRGFIVREERRSREEAESYREAHHHRRGQEQGSRRLRHRHSPKLLQRRNQQHHGEWAGF